MKLSALCDISFTIKSYSKVISCKDLVKSFSLCLSLVECHQRLLIFPGSTRQHLPPLNCGHLWYLTSSIMPDNPDRQVWQCPDRQIPDIFMMSDRIWHLKWTPVSDTAKIWEEDQNHKSDEERQKKIIRKKFTITQNIFERVNISNRH